MPKKILVAIDLSNMTRDLVMYGASLASRLDVEVDFIHVLPHPTLWRGYEPWLPPELDSEVHGIAKNKILYWLEQAEKRLQTDVQHKEQKIIIEEGNPPERIIARAQDGGYNLIVVGHKGHSPIEHLLVGSTTSSVARHAHCSVLIYRPGFDVF
ncbi:MAG: universal stress protein [Synergistales bacterium]|nr:universal stress protein [Synergistales bacterium]